MLSFAAPGFLELRGYRAGAAAIASRLAQGAAERHARPCCAIGAQAKAIHRGWEWDCENGALRSQPPTLDSARRQISPVACGYPCYISIIHSCCQSQNLLGIFRGSARLRYLYPICTCDPQERTVCDTGTSKTFYKHK